MKVDDTGKGRKTFEKRPVFVSCAFDHGCDVAVTVSS
jgi:hypothetical protein